MKRTHTNTRKELIKRDQRRYRNSRRRALFAYNSDTTKSQIAHDRMRRMRHSWQHLPEGMSPRPDRNPGFVPKLVRRGLRGYRAIGPRTGFMTSAGAMRLSARGVDGGHLVVVDLIQTPWGSVYSETIRDLITGKYIGQSLSTAFVFSVWHPAIINEDSMPGILLIPISIS